MINSKYFSLLFKLLKKQSDYVTLNEGIVYIWVFFSDIEEPCCLY